MGLTTCDEQRAGAAGTRAPARPAVATMSSASVGGVEDHETLGDHDDGFRRRWFP